LQTFKTFLPKWHHRAEDHQNDKMCSDPEEPLQTGASLHSGQDIVPVEWSDQRERLEPKEKRFQVGAFALYHTPRDRDQATRVCGICQADNDRITVVTGLFALSADFGIVALVINNLCSQL
jgi:hypothetical protein